MDEGLEQADLAKQFAVSVDTITNWENDRYLPMSRYISDIESFLETPIASVLAEYQVGNTLKQIRAEAKISQISLAREIGIGKNTLMAIENHPHRIKPSTLAKIEAYLAQHFGNKSKKDSSS